MDTTTDGLARVRELLARVTGDEKHDESSTSTLDALWVLYDRVLRVDPAAPDDPDRDRFVLSKGHGPVALYAILAAKGFIPETALDTFMDHGGILGSHPDRTLVPGVEASTGSLGHGLAIAVGIALALRADGRTDPRAICLVGDAEMNEGSNWEAVLIAPHLRPREPHDARDRQPQLDPGHVAVDRAAGRVRMGRGRGRRPRPGRAGDGAVPAA